MPMLLHFLHGLGVGTLFRGKNIRWYQNGCRTPQNAHATWLDTISVSMSLRESFSRSWPIVDKSWERKKRQQSGLEEKNMSMFLLGVLCRSGLICGCDDAVLPTRWD